MCSTSDIPLDPLAGAQPDPILCDATLQLGTTTFQTAVTDAPTLQELAGRMAVNEDLAKTNVLESACLQVEDAPEVDETKVAVPSQESECTEENESSVLAVEDVAQPPILEEVLKTEDPELISDLTDDMQEVGDKLKAHASAGFTEAESAPPSHVAGEANQLSMEKLHASMQVLSARQDGPSYFP